MTRPGRRRRADSPYAEQAARLAAWLRYRREQAQLSQQQLAARAELAVATVRKIETGAVIEPGYFTILALQQALGARYEDTTALPACLTLPSLVEAICWWCAGRAAFSAVGAVAVGGPLVVLDRGGQG